MFWRYNNLIASLLIQIGNCLYQSFDQISNGNYIEAFGQIGMSGMRGIQCKDQMEALQNYHSVDFELFLIKGKGLIGYISQIKLNPIICQ